MVLNINIPLDLLTRLHGHLSFIWKDNSIPYLDIHLPSSILLFYNFNYPPKRLEEKLDKWLLLDLSWLERIITVKIRILLLLTTFVPVLTLTCSNKTINVDVNEMLGIQSKLLYFWEEEV